MLLFLLNVPFVLFGLIKATMVYRTQSVSRISFLLRFSLWLVVLAGLIFARPIYEYLSIHGLTDSTPLSLADVVLTTGVVLAMTLVIRLYSKLDQMEKRFSDLQEKLSILYSTDK
jgi:hypothetical protein